MSDASHQIIADLLSARTGQHLTESRRWRIGTALAGVFREYGITNVDQLVCLLADPKEGDLAQEVVEALLNNETYFFRDKPTFDQLPDRILPELWERRANKRRLSIWCAGCSTGQEAYSLAMLFASQPSQWDGWWIDILGTDISHRAIDTARSGIFSQFEVQRGLSVAQMLQHFEETDQGWEISQGARKYVRFQQHNVLSLSPTQQPFDLILCRNVLLYFDPANRQQAFHRLSRSLATDGYLMLGAGETVVGQTDTFGPSAGLASIYKPTAALAPSALAATG
ncbi:MAG: CheR family methyltransferase [Pseudomonadota bacterium]